MRKNKSDRHILKMSRKDWARFWAKVEKRECWIWTSATSNGYGVFQIGRSNQVRAHRCLLVAKKAAPTLSIALHKCGNRLCVRPHKKHVVLGSIMQNAKDRIADGNHIAHHHRGSRCHMAKMNEQLVRLLFCEYWKGGVRAKDLAEKYGAPLGAVFAMLRRDTWKHVTDKINVPALRKGLRGAATGEFNQASKMTAAKVLSLRQQHARGVLGVKLAKKYNISNASVSAIVRRKTWDHL